LYFSVLDYAGTQAFDEATVEAYKENITNLIALAISIRMSKGSNFDETQARVHSEVMSLSDIYVKRYQNNYLMEGQAFGNDPLWHSDTQTCKDLIEAR